MLRRTALLLGISLLAGCGENFHTESFSFKDGNSLVVDAKQRAIIVMPTGQEKRLSGKQIRSDLKSLADQVEKSGKKTADSKVLANTILAVVDDKDFDAADRPYFICAEPSPDVASAISSSLSASFGGFFGNTQVQAALAAALAENIGQLGERANTTQLLRDQLFRNCEALMNGAISRDAYETNYRKVVTSTVASLAIERITGGNGENAAQVRTTSGGTVTTGTNVNIQSPQPAPAPNPSPAPQSGTNTSPAENPPTPPTPNQGAAASPNPSPTSPTPSEGAAAAQPENPSPSSPSNNQISNSSNSANANAAAPQVVINTGGNKTIDKDVAGEVRKIIEIYMKKDLRDFCTYDLDNLLAVFEKLGNRATKSGQNDWLNRSVKYVDACIDVLKQAAKPAVLDPQTKVTEIYGDNDQKNSNNKNKKITKKITETGPVLWGLIK